MSHSITGKPDLGFFRKMTAIGGLLLVTITFVNYYIPSDIEDFPLQRTLLAILAVAFYLASFKINWVKKHASAILAALIYCHTVFMVWSNYKNSFEIFDTSTSLIVGFALGAAFGKKEGLFGYLILMLGSYSLFFFHAEEVGMPADYFFITLLMLMSLAWLVFSSRISALEKLEKSQFEIAKSEKTFRNIFEWAPVGIVLLDLDLVPFKVNQVVIDHTGYSKQELIGTSMEKLVEQEDYKSSEFLINELNKSRRNYYTLEQRIIRRDGKSIWAKMSLTKLRSTKGEYLLAMIEDLSFQRKATKKLKSYATKLKEQNQALEDFSYVVSHDLQEPIRMIKSYTQLINRRYIKQMENEEAEKDMNFVIDGAERMNFLIRDMLAYTKMSAKALDKTKVNSADVVYDVIQNLAVPIVERNANIYIEELPEVSSSKVLFGQVMQNLIGNGLKYACEQRDAVIEVSAQKNERETVFCIKDNGVGFSKEEGEKIFGIFQRITKTANREKGTGIGLAICKRIVEKHGGNIWAEGVPNQGAKFYFSLPN